MLFSNRSQSGNPLESMTYQISPEEAVKRANETAFLVGCGFLERSRKESMVKCLKETHGADLVAAGAEVRKGRLPNFNFLNVRCFETYL